MVSVRGPGVVAHESESIPPRDPATEASLGCATIDPSAEIRDFLSERFPEAAELALGVRDVVLAADPDLRERIYSGWGGIGFRHPEAGYVCGIFPRAGEPAVRLLFEHGVELEGRSELLEGAGSQTRYVHVRALGPAIERELAELVSAAVGERLFRG